MKIRTDNAVRRAKAKAKRREEVRTPPRLADPSRTGTERRAAAMKVRRAWARIRGRLRRLVLTEDAFGIKRRAELGRLAGGTTTGTTTNAPPGRFAFESDASALAKFEEWLQEQFDAELTGATKERLWEEFARQGFERGAGRAFDDLSRAARARATEGERNFMTGGRREFLLSAFARPEAVDKLKLLASRT